MASNHNTSEGLGDDFLDLINFLDQILSIPAYVGNDGNLAGTMTGGASMMLQLSSSSGGGDMAGAGGGYHHVGGFPLGLSLEQGKGVFFKSEDASGSGGGGGNKRFLDDFVDLKAASANTNQFHGHPTPGAAAVVQHPPSIRPRVRARRGQATDPHSIAERLRRERIAERMKALQELVPSSNKTDRAAMLDEIVDYVKFLRLQVKVLSMSRLGGAGAVAQLVADIPLSSTEGGAIEGSSNQPEWEKWSTDGTEHQVAKLMEEDVGGAMQFLQSKALCIMPISLASAIYHTQQTEPNAP